MAIRLRIEFKELTPIIMILALIGAFIYSLTCCKSPTSPDGLGEADITIHNEYGQPLDIYVNGNFRFTIQNNTEIEIDDVPFGNYTLEAKEVNTDIIVKSETLKVEEKIDYLWIIDDPPDINVINQFGRTLKIYMDGAYQFDLAHEENRWIIDVTYGEHFLKAVRASDSKQVASVTIYVGENTDYSWTVGYY